MWWWTLSLSPLGWGVLRVGNLWEASAVFSLINVIYLQCTSGGILRGTGNQKVGAIVNAIGYYVIGLPVGISLMFATKLGVIGKYYPGEGISVLLLGPRNDCWHLQASSGDLALKLWNLCTFIMYLPVRKSREWSGQDVARAQGSRFMPLLPCQALFYTDLLKQSRMTFLLLSLSCVIKLSLLRSWWQQGCSSVHWWQPFDGETLRVRL